MSRTLSLLHSDHTEDAVVPVDSGVGGPSLHDYDLGAKLGEGGNASVYRAVEKSSGNAVALKLIHKKLITDPRFYGRFEREVRAASRLEHPNICRVLASGETAGELWIAMELVDGGSLNELIERQGRLPPQVACILVDALLAALGAAHDARILHRDIKPHNIMVTRGGTLKLVDFGIARGDGDAKVTETGFLVGTPAYMSPEQVTGRPIDHRSDLYAAGIVLYEMLTGENPYARFAPSTAMLKIATEPLPAIMDIDDSALPTLDRATSALIDRDVHRRPATAADARRQLAPLLSWIGSRHPDVVGEYLTAPAETTRALRTELFELNARYGDALVERGIAHRPGAVLAWARALRFVDDADVRAKLSRLCLEGTFTVGPPAGRVAAAVAEAEQNPGNATLWRRLADVARAEGHLPLAARGLRRWLASRDDPTAALQLRKLLGDGDGPTVVSGLSTRELVCVTGSASSSATQTGEAPRMSTQLAAPRRQPPQPAHTSTGVTKEPPIAFVLPLPAVSDEAPLAGRWMMVAAATVGAVAIVIGAGRLIVGQTAQTQRALSENVAHVGAIEENNVQRRDDNRLLDARTALARRKPGEVIRLINEVLNEPDIAGATKRNALWLRAQAFELTENRYAARRDYLEFLDLSPVTDDRYADARGRIERLGSP